MALIWKLWELNDLINTNAMVYIYIQTKPKLLITRESIITINIYSIQGTNFKLRKQDNV